MSLFNGEYIIYNKGGLVKYIIPNAVTQIGQTRFYESVFQNLDAGKSIGTLEIGLIDEVPAYAGVVADITTEPTTQGGYGRKALPPNAASWTVDSINGEGRVTSNSVSWSPTGSNYSRSFSRLMLVEQGAEILSYSSPLPSPLLLLIGQTFFASYRMYKK